MRSFLNSLILSLILISPAWATTYYVRSAGGTSTQCTGQANADYDGSGTGEACAFNHPFYATDYYGDYGNGDGDPAGIGVMTGGDDLVIVSGSYNMGYSATWSGCSSSWAYGCVAKEPPDGTAENHTKIIGCTINGCTNPEDRPELYGVGRSKQIFVLNGSDYVDISDLELTDHGVCGEGHATLSCGETDYQEQSVSDGITGINWTNISLSNLDIHGLRSAAIRLGKGANLSMVGVSMYGNAFAGWDADVCQSGGFVCNSTCNNQGYGMTGEISLVDVSVTYNGCIENYPAIGTIAPKGCYSQDQSGYGDGIGTCDTGGNWTITESNISHNVSDGLDLLYMNQRGYSGGEVVIKRSLFEGNAGNQVKVPSAVTIEDSVIIGNCGYFNGQTFTCDSATCGNDFNNCRAFGNVVSITFKDDTIPKIYSSTLISNGDVGVLTGGTCAEGTDVDTRNSILRGGWEFGQDDTSSIFYNADGTCSADFAEQYNICYGWKEGTSSCEGTGSTDTVDADFSGTVLFGISAFEGYYTDADFADQLYISAAEGGADETVSGSDALDYNSFNRGAEWDRGALEYGSVPSDGGDPETYHKFIGILKGKFQ